MATISTDAAAELIANAFAPLTLWTDDGQIVAYVSRLGFFLPAVTPGFRVVGTAAKLLNQPLADVVNARLNGDDPPLAPLVVAVGAVIASIQALPDSLTAAPPDGLPDTYLQQTGIVDQIEQRLLDRLIVDVISDSSQVARSFLFALGLIEEVAVPVPDHPDTTIARVRTDRLSLLISDQKALLSDVYGWGTPDIKEDQLFAAIREVGQGMLSGGVVRVPSDAFVSAMFPGAPTTADVSTMLEIPLLGLSFPPLSVGAMPAPNINPGDPQALALLLIGSQDLSITVPLGIATISLTSDLTLDAGVGILVHPGLDTPPTIIAGVEASPSPGSSGKVTLRIERAASDFPFTVATFSGGSEVQIKSYFVELVLDIGGSDFVARAGVEGGLLSISTADGDGFLSQVLPAGGMNVAFDLAVGWSKRRGVFLTGSAGFETTLTLNLELGPVTVEAVHLAVKADEQGLHANAGADVTVDIGPVTGSVSGIGAKALLQFKSGNLGPVDLGAGFLAPTGIGIAVDSGSVSGGGFLFFDEPNGRYGGALELSAYDIAIKAFGLIETKVPGVAFSFVIVISAEFTPIQLGFGFTLDGVGGLIGINRTVDSKTLAARVRDGTLDNVLFPHNLIQNAPAIISELASLFPAAAAHYTFGPLAKLGWIGLVHGTLGLILELPSKAVTIIGNINAILPKPDDAIVVLDMDIGGKLDFPKKHFELDATLSPNSKVGAYTTSGDMAMRLDWGDNPNFAISLGGFHSQFTPPPGFPSLRRLAIDLGIKGNPSVTLQGFMALTSNTAQIGASLDVYASEYGATLTGTVGFEALFVFSPFSFDARVWGGVHVDFEGVGFGLTLDGRIRGPSPWIIDGEVCVSLWIASACVGIHKQLDGAPPPETLPLLDPWEGSPVGAALSAQDVHGLKPAIVELSNWAGRLPPGAIIGVTYVQRKDQKQPVDPVGIATFRQKSVPLDYDISRFAGRPPIRPGKLQITSVTAGGVSTTSNYVTDFFAPGQYRQMSNDEVLAAKSFEQLNAGVELQGKVATLGSVKARPLTYRTVVLDAQGNELPGAGQDHQLPPRHLDGLVGSTSASRLSARLSGRTRFIDITQAPRLTAQIETFSLVLKANLSLVGTTTTNIPRSSVAAALDALAGKNTLKRQQYQIIGSYALAAA